MVPGCRLKPADDINWKFTLMRPPSACSEKAAELGRLRQLCLDRFAILEPQLCLELPPIPETGPTKPVEDQIDAVICAYIAAHFWYWGRERNTVYGANETGFIVVPRP